MTIKTIMDMASMELLMNDAYDYTDDGAMTMTIITFAAINLMMLINMAIIIMIAIMM